MDESLPHRNDNPILEAGPLSKLFFWWLNPLFKKGYARRLDEKDMYNVCLEEQSQLLGDRLEREWLMECMAAKESNTEPSLTMTFIRMFGLRYILLGCVLIVVEAAKFLQPLLLGGLVRYFTTDSTVTTSESYLYAMGIGLCAVTLAVLHHPLYFNVNRIGMRMRIACCSLIYRKTLRLSNDGLRNTSTGQIVNMMSNDVNHFDKTVKFINYMWVGVIELVAVVVLLVLKVGVSALAGVAVLLFIMFLQAEVGKLFLKFRQKTLKFTDKRVKTMNEVIAGMRIVKMYCWEKPFGDFIAKIRKSELYNARATGYLTVLMEVFVRSSLHLCVYAVIVLFYIGNHHFRAETIYILIGLLNAISLNILIFVSLGIRTTIQMNVSIMRIKKFLLLEELHHRELLSGEGKDVKVNECSVLVEDVSAKWDKLQNPWTLKNITVRASKGDLLAVIGHVGAGKSSLLMSVLQELPVLKGNVNVIGQVAYVSQQPWIFSGSLRQNITFGNEYIKAKYDKIIDGCALDVDISLLPNGDSTLIGDRGVTLSGGQRTRVSLARALYMNADIYLLDDPLSAVDKRVGKSIFENVIQGLLKGKIVILVTHQLQFLKFASHIVVLEQGTVIGSGTFEELSPLVAKVSASLKHLDEKAKYLTKHSAGCDAHDSNKHTPTVLEHPDKKYTKATISVTTIANELQKNAKPMQTETDQQQPDEECSSGTIGWRIYLEYYKAGSGLFKGLALIILLIIAEGASVACDWWLAHWTNEGEKTVAALDKYHDISSNLTNSTIPRVNSKFNLIVYSCGLGSMYLLCLVRGSLFMKMAFDSSQKLHDGMFSSIIRSQMRFFDTNPVGRVLNRFSKDIGHIDDLLPITMNDFLQCCMRVMAIVCVACVINPWILIAILPLCVSFIIIRQYYLQTSRHVKRLEGKTRSPVFSHLSASLQGLHTIRALRVQKRFIKEFDTHQDLHSEAWFLFISTTGWFASKLDWICAIFVTVVASSSVISVKDLNPGLVGLAVTYAMSLTWVFQWGVRQSAEVENQMVSVERVLQYSNLAPEASLVSTNKQAPPHEWPQEGGISVTAAHLRYSESLPFILKDLSFKIYPKEKIGIVGRTGAGKSSLITMLFRLVEPEGEIIIDTISIKNIGLHDLRSKISIIPQDPVLFTGTLRRNLDPFGNLQDCLLWKALSELVSVAEECGLNLALLETPKTGFVASRPTCHGIFQVQLEDVIKALPNGLDTEVSEGGINFSVGQRQLICLARAILRQNKILILDEATANVDSRTDDLIQTTIREQFKFCTVLTIAHRLNTVMDSDRIMVLNEGRLVEFDVPYILLQKQAGPLYELVTKTGTVEAYNLLQIAKDVYTRTLDSLSISTKNITSNISSCDPIKDNPVNHSFKQASLAETMHNASTVERTFDFKNNGNGISEIKTLPIEDISEHRIANYLVPLDSVCSQHEHVSSCTEDTHL